MTDDELRARMIREVGPARLDLRDLKPPPSDGPRLPMVRSTRFGQGVMAVGALIAMIALVLLPFGFDWFMDHYVPPIIKKMMVGVAVAYVVGCFVHIEISRRRGRPRITP